MPPHTTASATKEGRLIRLQDVSREVSNQQAAAEAPVIGSDALRDTVNGLRGSAWTALKLLFFLAWVPIRHEEIGHYARRNFKGKREAWSALKELNRKGLLVALEPSTLVGMSGAPMLVMLPDEVRMASAYRIVDEIKGKGMLRPFPAPSGGEREEGLEDDLHDLTTLLADVGRLAPKVTRSGVIFKRDQKKLLAHFRRPGEVPKGNDAAYPLGLSLLMGYASAERLVAVQDDGDGARLTITPYADRWAIKPPAWRLARYQAHWYLASLMEGPIRPVLELCLALPEGAGLLLESVLQWVERMLGQGELTRNFRFNFNYLQPLWKRVGLVRMADAPGDGGGVTNRRRDAAHYLVAATIPQPLSGPDAFPELEEECFVVQPNFEVLISQEASAKRVWRLYRCCELIRSDRMMRFALTRESIQAAIETGFTGAEIMQFLEAESRFPLPENVRYSLGEWTGRTGRSRIVEGILLRCDTEELADQLFSLPQIERYLLERVGPTHFLVDPVQTEQLAEALERAGWPPARHLYAATAEGLIRKAKIGTNPRPAISHGGSAFVPREPGLDDAPLDEFLPEEANWETHIGGRSELPLDHEGAGSLRPVPIAAPDGDLLDFYEVVPVKERKWDW